MSVSVGYGDWNQISTFDADLDINDSGGSYGPAGVTYGRFNCQNWATFALDISTIVGNLDIAVRYYPSETGAALLTRELWLDATQAPELAAFFPNMAPWLDVFVQGVGGGNFQLNAFGWRSNRQLPSIYVPQSQFLINSGSVTINTGTTHNFMPTWSFAGSMGYRVATNTHAGTLTVQVYNGGYVTVHTETVAASSSSDGILLLPEGLSRWQISNSSGTNDTYSLNVWPAILAQR